MPKVDISGLSYETKLIIAKDNCASADILAILSEESNASIREAVAANSNTLYEILANLAKDRWYCVRETVAANPNYQQNKIS